MNDTNLVIISGRLTATPEMRTTKSGTAVLDLSIATNRSRKNAEGELTQSVVFNRVTLWGAQAQYWAPAGAGKLSKGDSVLVEGSLADDNYVSKDGEKTFGRIKIDHVQTFNLVARHRDIETAVIDAGEPEEEMDNGLPVV